jgi:hypothetical protein
MNLVAKEYVAAQYPDDPGDISWRIFNSLVLAWITGMAAT